MKSFIVLFLLFFSCSGVKKVGLTNSQCNENIEFKEQFFKNIKVIDDFMAIGSETEFKDIDEYERIMTADRIKEFDSSLKFISKYAHVSFESMANYNKSYPIGVFKKDKEGWLKWYEENKCKNIQFK